MYIFNNKGRISFIEFFTIVFLIVCAGFLGVELFGLYKSSMNKGNDAMYVNTAQSVAAANSLNGIQCPVNGCGGKDCTHKKGEYYVGYFNSVSHKIDAYPSKGYNQASELHIGDKKYYGDIGTMVIEVMCKDGQINLLWVKSK